MERDIKYRAMMYNKTYHSRNAWIVDGNSDLQEENQIYAAYFNMLPLYLTSVLIGAVIMWMVSLLLENILS
jgi:hypothetical protein